MSSARYGDAPHHFGSGFGREVAWLKLKLRFCNRGRSVEKARGKNDNFDAIFYPRGPRGKFWYPLVAKNPNYEEIKSDQIRGPNLARNLDSAKNSAKRRRLQHGFTQPLLDPILIFGRQISVKILAP